MRLVLDTNVLVSAALRPLGPPAQLLQLWRENRYDLVTSPALIAEIQRVLRYPRVQKAKNGPSEGVERFLSTMVGGAEIVHPSSVERVVPNDPDDDQVVAAAVAAKADAIVSGDAHLLSLGSCKGIPVFTPKQALEFLAGKDSPPHE